MKEVTYEDWQKNPTPRMMWVWDYAKDHKVRRKVVYVIKNDVLEFQVLTIKDDDTNYETYRHCAEIEKQRRMTNKELSWWLSEKPHREKKYVREPYIYHYNVYDEKEKNEEVSEDIVIREDDGEWREPLVEE